MSELFAEFNHTELYQMARNAGITAAPSTTRDDLIKYLNGEVEPPPVVHEIDHWRHGIMGFLLEHWRAMETQLTCPAKTKDPRACFNCLDTQVVACLVQNEKDIHLIRRHKKAE